ncbi:MAG TPA: hypothetical protein VIT93_01830 [Dehalococcoidia bacterium]
MILLVRLLHGALTAFFTACIGYVYYAALTRRSGRLLWGAIGALAVEGVVVVSNGGDCPLGAVHHRYGDERDFFELIMPRRLSRRAVPVLGVIAITGVILALVRRREPQIQPDA